jgi:diketogulonate reductase-like aldo/keto reductase
MIFGGYPETTRQYGRCNFENCLLKAANRLTVDICSALFLVEQLRKDGKLPALGGLLAEPKDTFRRLADRRVIPSLAFGLYNVPLGREGVVIISKAIEAGYRHFDAASIYKNEVELGEAIRRSGIPREEFFITSKVWNDAQKEGPDSVRQSIERSLRNLKCGYMDIMYVHWPVPGHFVESYKVIQEYHVRGLVRNIGISNFGYLDYEELMNSDGIHVTPAVNQIEISPFMYRPTTIEYFQKRGIAMVSSKSLYRAVGMEHEVVQRVSKEHSVTSAQVLLRWGIQKGFVVICKTSNPDRMVENRNVMSFSLTEHDVMQLDSLTSKEQVAAREELEIQRREGI